MFDWLFNKKILAESYCNRASSNMHSDKYLEAIDNFSKAIEIDPSNIHAYHSRGLCKKSLHNYPGALADLKKAIELDPLNKLIQLSLKEVEEKIEHFKDEIESSNKDIEKSPSWLPYYKRGIAKYNLNNRLEALEDLNKAKGLGYYKAEELIQKIQSEQ